MADEFNKFFVNIGSKLANKIQNSNKDPISYLKHNEIKMNETPLTEKEFFEAFNTLKSNKSQGVDEISANMVKMSYDIIKDPLLYIFDLSIRTGKFPNSMKIAKVTPVFKTGDKTNPSNYRPISVLPCFSKILERIMYNRVFNYILDNNFLYKKQFGFQKSHSTDHAVLNLVNDILFTFDKDEFTLGVFIDLSKAFDTVDHQILIAKLKHYGVDNNNLLWFKDYLSNRKQCIYYENEHTQLRSINCGVPQGSILGPLLFLIYVNDLHYTSNLLNFILFADDTNIFLSHKNINTLYKTLNKELKKVEEWFRTNKLSLNTNKTKYTIFFKPSKRDDLPLKLPKLEINNAIIKNERSIKFLGILLDENLNWKKHIGVIENKISKNLGILKKAKPYLNLTSLKHMYFALIHSYLNYCNIVWASTNQTKLKKLFSKQKYASRIIFNEKQTSPPHSLFVKLGSLDIYKLNIHQVLLFMFKSKNKITPRVFHDMFKPIEHIYNTRHSKNNFMIPKTNLKISSFAIQHRGPLIWNQYLQNELKTLNSFSSFKTKSTKVLLYDEEVKKHLFF